jgi:hypothetical protein
MTIPTSKEYSKYISQSLTAGTEHMKKGSVAYVGKVFKNLANKATTTFHQIQTLFEKGKWINDKSAMKELTKSITYFKESLNLDYYHLTDKERKSFWIEVGQMKEVCKILKDSGCHHRHLETIQNDLTSIEGSLGVKKNKIERKKELTHTAKNRQVQAALRYEKRNNKRVE